jgi:hypothetical protein
LDFLAPPGRASFEKQGDREKLCLFYRAIRHHIVHIHVVDSLRQPYNGKVVIIHLKAPLDAEIEGSGRLILHLG